MTVPEGEDIVNISSPFFSGVNLGGGDEATAAPPFSSSEIFFKSKYTIILSFCKQAVGWLELLIFFS